jgi:hypothetical protein
LDPRADLEAIHPRQHQIEHDQVGAMFRMSAECIRAVGRDDHVIALTLETGSNGFGDRVLVLDDEHGLGCHGVIVSTAPRAAGGWVMEKSWRERRRRG